MIAHHDGFCPLAVAFQRSTLERPHMDLKPPRLYRANVTIDWAPEGKWAGHRVSGGYPPLYACVVDQGTIGPHGTSDPIRW
jgi:hypothetical protein